MFEKLIGVEERHSEVEKLLSDPKIVQDRVAYQKYVREHSDLNKIVTVYRQYKRTLQNLADSQELLKDVRQNISFTTSIAAAVEQSVASFIIVPTPSNPDGDFSKWTI